MAKITVLSIAGIILIIFGMWVVHGLFSRFNRWARRGFLLMLILLAGYAYLKYF